ncbi:MAG: transposase, partial [Prevotella sp.]|nr:transposase [Prevotella sp.]
TCFWTEIVRRLSTQKAITTEATNVLGKKVPMRLCSEPNKSADDIYERLKYKKMPFRKIKIKKSL